MTTIKTKLPNNDRRIIFRISKCNYQFGWYVREEDCFKYFKNDEIMKYPVVDVLEWWEIPPQGSGFKINQLLEQKRLLSKEVKIKLEGKIDEEESE